MLHTVSAEMLLRSLCLPCTVGRELEVLRSLVAEMPLLVTSSSLTRLTGDTMLRVRNGLWKIMYGDKCYIYL